ncbi:MAG: beta-N-acetylhexosaminidase [Chitinophagaceae bacterium]|nr:beta-N-acetylhexosaminidase [Chitinophagaceae bacterium]
MSARNLPIFLCLFIVAISSCNQQTAETPAPTLNAVIPLPLDVVASSDVFTFDTNAAIVTSGGAEATRIATMFADMIQPATGFKLIVSESADTSKAGTISLALTGNEGTLGAEGYELNITKDKIFLIAAKPAGLFYGIQTIRQLLPHSIESSKKQNNSWTIATGKIVDKPEYGVRGSMLDVARHFFSLEDVKRYIDFLAFYKMNTFHWHLSDDQGWRIEIKSWPKLTSTGGSTQVGGGKGGFYTQEQYKELIKYASDRFITVIPEIDMPGHTNAALASYPELNCNDSATKLYSGTEVGFSSLCTNKDITYKFIDDVIRELAELTPGAYLHIGGDESHATKKEDYIPFVNKVQAIVKKHNKLVIGWDEIALSTLTPNSVAQYWADSANSVNAVKQGAKIMMSPAAKAYLDMQYDSTSKLGLHWAAYIEVDQAYNWNPETLVKGISKENIYGIEAPLWSETVTNMNDIEWLVFPRLPGYAEIGWTPSGKRNWDEYKTRLANHGARLTAMDIDFYKSKRVEWKGE